MSVEYETFFRTATGLDGPFDYQRRLAEDPECNSRLINIPTGCGKTAAVVLAWLWNRAVLQHADWPHRLIYCLPMRTLVEQTRDTVRKWLSNLDDREWEGAGSHDRKVGLHILMGGEEREENPWDLFPEREAILIGTQDMLLSRALNRGYGMSRYRWPMHFGLLNNDALWVFDEIQLMGSGLPTTAQLEAFREKMPPAATCLSWWMSATSKRDWLKTVDFDPATLGAVLQLSDEERESERVKKLLDAPKHVRPVTAAAESFKLLAKEIVNVAEESSGLTLVVVNKVKTARKLFAEVKKLTRKAGTKPLLLHSRFRPDDRAKILREVLDAENERRVVISTQVIEAGVDLSAATLFTELAPWTSLVQRFGRCNRRGDPAGGKIFWIEPADAAPYEKDQLDEARKRLEELPDANASPNALREVPIPDTDRPKASHVIRKKDLVELFDTTPDLAGNDIDIDRWVRETGDSTVQLFWREWEGGGKRKPRSDEQKQPRREELCSASITEFRDFVKKSQPPVTVWRWDFLEGEWSSVREFYPGQIYLLPSEAGGYVSGDENKPATGWTPESKERVKAIAIADVDSTDKQTDDEPLSQTGIWQSIAQHTDQVCEQLDLILSEIFDENAALLRHAARWHDWGKAHEAFQEKLNPDAHAERDSKLNGQPMAKAPKGKWQSPKLGKKRKPDEKRRKFFRHELASALGVLLPETPIPLNIDRDLVAYLIAAHHGKVRLSIRSLPGEWQPPEPHRFARGVWDFDTLPRTLLGGKGADETFTPNATLSLEPMELGLGQTPPFVDLPSWSERMLALRDSLGPFRLAFLETLLRAADERASALASLPSKIESKPDEPQGTNPEVERTSERRAASPSNRGSAGKYLLEHVDGGGAGESRVAEGSSLPYGATRYLDTNQGRLSYSEIADLLAARAAEIQLAIATGAYAEMPLDEQIVALIHRDLCENLVPEWAGAWRTIAVTVGSHEPTPPHQVAPAMRDYAADLQARWNFIIGHDESLLLESLAFAEGRFLTVHPFHDFNGRAVRLWLREILRRASLPEVRLEVHSADEKEIYLAALRATDRHDLEPLKTIWRQRFAEIA
jgi:CRISPR-associated endonuclease/helicase Cas3